MRHDQAFVPLPVIFPVVFVHFIQFHNPEEPLTDGVLAQIWHSGRDDRGQAQNFWWIRVWHTDGCSATTAFARIRLLCALIGQTRRLWDFHWAKVFDIIKCMRWLDAKNDNQMFARFWMQFMDCVYKMMSWTHDFFLSLFCLKQKNKWKNHKRLNEVYK